MSAPMNDGGPAFPSAVLFDQAIVDSKGMTLRDYFAAKAMQSIVGAMLIESSKTRYNIDHQEHLKCVALDSYEIADAMLRARKSK